MPGGWRVNSTFARKGDDGVFHRKKILWLLLLPGLAGLIAFYVAPLIGGVYF